MAFFRRPASWRRLLARCAVAAALLFLLIQAVPYGRAHSNPPVTQEPQWDTPATRELAVRACFDCHSNQTDWRWYSNIAPVSWLVQSDVDGGRSALNFSEWNRPQGEGLDEVLEVIRGGSMPPWTYTPVHPSARLSASEKDALVSGLRATFAASPPGG